MEMSLGRFLKNEFISVEMKATMYFFAVISVWIVLGSSTILALDTDVVSSSVDGTCACGGRRDSILGTFTADHKILSGADTDSTGATSPADHLSVSDVQKSASTDSSRLSKHDSSHERKALLQQNVENMVYIEGGSFFMGTDNAIIQTDGEGPKRLVTLSDFMIDK